MANGDDLTKNSAEFNENISDASLSARSLVDSLSDFGKGQIFRSLNKDVRELADELEKSVGFVNKIKQGEVDYGKARSQSAKVSKLNEQIQAKSSKLEDQILKKLKDKNSIEAKSLRERIRGLKDTGDKSNKMFRDAANFAKKGDTASVRMATNMSKAFKGAGLNNAAKGTQSIANSMRKAALSGTRVASGLTKVLGIAKILVKTLGFAGGFGGLLLQVVLIAIDLVKLFLKVNSEVVGISKALGVSQDRARELREGFQGMAIASENVLNNYHQFMMAASKLNDMLGASLERINTADFFSVLDGMATLQNRMGLTEDAAAGFALRAMAAGKSTMELADATGRGVLNFKNMFGTIGDLQKGLEASGKISGELRAIYFQYPEALGEAVTTAQLLGTSLEAVFKSSKGILNFEQSINKEIEARIFGFENLNLNAMRYARLTGDMVTYEKELVKNAGSYADFTTSSTLAREALAGALELEVDALEEILFRHMTLSELQKLEGTRQYEITKQRMQQMDLMQQFNAAMDKLKYIIIDIFDGIEKAKPPLFLSLLFGLDPTKPLGQQFNMEGAVKSGERAILDSGFGTAVAGSKVIPREMQDGSITIQTAARDQAILQVGSRLFGGGGSNEAVVAAVNENTRAVMQDKEVVFDLFRAGGTRNYLAHDPDRWTS